MIVAKATIVDLQAFLMYAATELAFVRGESDEQTKELLGASAALDYALLLAYEHGYGSIDDDSDAARAMRSTMTDAAKSAVDAIEHMLDARDVAYEKFLEKRVYESGIAALIRALFDRGVAAGDDLAFRALTVANDVFERHR